VLLTGAPGVGKSTLIQRQITALVNRPAGGFYTRELRRAGRRIGFEMVTLTGKTALLASAEPDAFANGPKVGRYRVNLSGIEEVAVPALLCAWEAGALVSIDEIGPMEIFSDRFCQVVMAILDDGAPVLGTVVARPYRFADAVKQHPSVNVVEVTVANRDRLAGSRLAG
jgi:nucleoside-triphosphatase